MTTWLVAYDFSDQARVALRLAIDQLSGLGGGTLLLLNVQPPMPDGVGVDLGGMTSVVIASDRDAMDEARRALSEHVATLPTRPGVTLTHRVALGRPADAIVETATEIGADQIVIGSHGRRGIERMLLGSVAERVIRLADRPVLVVKTATVG
ncbi:MAG: universal stress protein [Myxococcota bacterium]